MKRSLFFAVFLLVAGALGSCQKTPVRPVSQEIVGEWQWVSSIGGLTGTQKETPASTGSALTYRFNPDSSFVQCGRNGSQPYQCAAPSTFRLRRERSILFGDQRLVLTIRRKVYLAPPDTGFHILLDRYIVQNISNELVVDQDRPDGFEKKFNRN